MSTVSEGDAKWLRYPTNLEEYYDPIAIDYAACIGQIDCFSDVVFSKGTKLEVLESTFSNRKIESEDGLDAFLRSTLDPPLQIAYVLT